MKRIVKKLMATILCFSMIFSIISSSGMVISFADDTQNNDIDGISDEIGENITQESSEEEVYIIAEDTEKRNSNTKHFLMSDGSYQAAVYPDAVHYKVDDSWEEIDNTLQISNKDSVTGYENKSNSFKAKFAQNSNSYQYS